MPARYDLVIRNGCVHDGLGHEAIAADVAVQEGIIVDVGPNLAAGAEEVDATDKLVTPGFVDIHTHYDAQAIWDDHLTPSSLHGVTSVVMGNCGVGFAPCRPADRQKLIELMEGVEDIPGAVMHEGLEWSWESFSEYLDALDRRPRDIDVAALLPHAAVRVFVMGERALRLENANPADIEQMREITADAFRAGAFGFSTSRTTSHKSLNGDYTPTLRAQEAELTGMALGLKDAGGGMMEVVSEWNQPGPAEEFGMLRRISETSGRPIIFSLSERNSQPGMYRQILKLAGEAIEDGVNVRPVVAPRAIGVLLGLEASQNPFSGTPSYKKIVDLPLAERVQAMRDASFKAQILSEDPIAESTFPLIHRLSYAQMFRFGDPPNYQPTQADSLEAIANREGRSAPEVAYDELLANEGRGFIYSPISNYASYDLSASETLLSDKNSIMGLGDAGAHVGFILDAGYPTWLMTHWSKASGKFSIEEVIRRLTSDTARAANMTDRGVIAPGMKADLNVIDWERIGFDAPYMVRDLPAGGGRLMQKARGYEATIVSGAITFREGYATGALPGKLLRGYKYA
jgi:N-acyl-D-aspartate/D-glutamate deacylase